ncbi:MAG: class I SAM-dependent methyltransferase [Acidobacteria bacterium]|nr:MAG: class I SAM-dependent methyltransferase [Acidobacteriota bacterium]REK03095.1 MAG: class I SAM-dependent methyltransferase [Acidobacteriota bacterium]REK15443.1 MAG: class I SAM-dependent methyltransferase [Acidobacteriota bacterium]REK45794.1 MAG: class I SAM-dependent methyltransferase [Acidobacteriota bacterium]
MVRKSLKSELRDRESPVSILDVGGRKSPYTIGIPAAITIIDLPRESEVQNDLNLGITDAISESIKTRRSNIEAVLFGDMTKSDLPSESFDVVVSVEVLEHVEEDDKFVSEISRVLKPGGRFIMTTPNGDFVENRNPDHKRHYKRSQLMEVLRSHFEEVRVEYAIAGGYYRRIGLKSWSIKKPIQTSLSAFGNIVNTFESSRKGIEQQATGTHHLFATATKSGGEAVQNGSEKR